MGKIRHAKGGGRTRLSCLFILKPLKDILQRFKFVDWRIRGFVFLMSRTGYLTTKKEVLSVAIKNILFDLSKRFKLQMELFSSSLNHFFSQFQVFGSDRIRAFGMAKFLSAHLS